MKRLYLLLLITVFVMSEAFATVVTQRKVNSESKNRELVENIRTCKPYTESMNSDYMGMNMSYNLQIKGWINNKCRLDFEAKVNGAGSSFKDLYGISASDATVISFAPKIRCEFSKQQLEYVGDSILQEEERSSGAYNNMLKDPKSINMSSFASMSDSDQKLMDVIVNQGACTILNMADLDKTMKSLY